MLKPTHPDAMSGAAPANSEHSSRSKSSPTLLSESKDEPSVHSAKRSRSLRACIRVPSTHEGDKRTQYESVPAGPERRQAWVDRVLGQDGVYIGRPKNDGGWYQVPMVKHGSIFANPFPLKDYSLDESLRLYEEYMLKRLSDTSTVEEIIGLLPSKERDAANKYYVTDKGKGPGKSTAHFQLNIRCEALRQKLLDLDGKTLGCFCEPDSPCHADVLLKLIAEVKCTSPEAKRNV